jgi:hypothetical protein
VPPASGFLAPLSDVFFDHFLLYTKLLVVVCQPFSKRKRMPQAEHSPDESGPRTSSGNPLPTFKDQAREVAATDAVAATATSAAGVTTRRIAAVSAGSDNVDDRPTTTRDQPQRIFDAMASVELRPAPVSQLTESGEDFFVDAARQEPMIIVQAVEVLDRDDGGGSFTTATNRIDRHHHRPGPATTTVAATTNTPPTKCKVSWKSLTMILVGCVLILASLAGCVARDYCSPAADARTTMTAVETPAPTPIQSLSPVWAMEDFNASMFDRTQDVDLLLRWEHAPAGTNVLFDEDATSDLQAVLATTIDSHIASWPQLWMGNLTRVTVETKRVMAVGSTTLETALSVTIAYQSEIVHDVAEWVRTALWNDQLLLRQLQNTNDRFAVIQSLTVAVNGVVLVDTTVIQSSALLSGLGFIQQASLYVATIGILIDAV